jgi:hypothetical protein
VSSLASLSTKQWLIILVLLALNVVCVYAGAIPLAVTLTANSATPAAVASSIDDPSIAAAPTESIKISTRTPTRTRTPQPSATPIATATSTPAPTETSIPTVEPTATSAPQAPSFGGISPKSLAELELDPHASLATKTTFFTSACFGDGANLLQDRDFMAPADWSSAPERKCIFGFNVSPVDSMPRGRYSVFGGPDGVPRFYIIPPDAFAQDQTHLKQLSQMHLIIDPDAGCDALGAIGMTADGQTYQCNACDFLRTGGVCANVNHSVVLPRNKNIVFDPEANGGAYGFANYPALIFRRGFSLYFTGKAGYAPPRTWFESTIDTLAPGVNTKTTAEMSLQESRDIAAHFDAALSGINPIKALAALEQEIPATSPAPIAVKSRDKGTITFAAPPGTVLSSIVWKIKPLNNVDDRKLLETNLCLDLNGEEFCFTGVEDFAHCAFYTPCNTGYSNLIPTEAGGYLATRYFLPGAAPLITHGNLTAKFQTPDNGAVLEFDVKLRVRRVDVGLGR